MSVNFHLLLAALLAIVAPLGLLITRRELLKVRTVIVEELIETVFKGQGALPQIELVLARYRTRSRRPEVGQTTKGRQASASPYLGGLVFALLCFVGFLLLLTPFDLLMSPGHSLRPDLSTSAFWSFPQGGRGDLADRADVHKAASGAGFGFLGGYIFQLSFLTRAALNQELSALSFIRASFRLLVGILLAVAVYRVLGGLIDAAGSGLDSVGLTQAATPVAPATATPVPRGAGVTAAAAAPGAIAAGFGAALGVAFMTGYFPENAISAISRRVRVRLKLVSEAALAEAEVIPVEVVDGIDSEVSVRLQESNIYDIQNLAVANPIALYAETPYGIFDSFDWVLQAQLCLVVGVKGFHALREHKIRTIFDLERAVLADGAPKEYVCAIGAIVLDGADEQFKKRIGLITTGTSPEISPDVVRHVIAILGDDLHVHRLRILWKALMESTTTGSNPWLFETAWLPGEADRLIVDLSPAAEADVAIAAAAGQGYRAGLAAKLDAAALAALRNACFDAVVAAAAHGSTAKDRLRRLWDPERPRKRASEHALEDLYDDPAFKMLLG